jgi:uncharacterized membrane protein
MRLILRGDDEGSTIPLILGFFLLAMLVVAGSIALGDAFVQQRDLQDVCDGAAAAAAASSADLDRERTVGAAGTSLPFSDADQAVAAYLDRDSDRRAVQIRAQLSADRQRITLTCIRTTELTFGGVFGRGHVRHVASSTARAAVIQ